MLAVNGDHPLLHWYPLKDDGLRELLLRALAEPSDTAIFSDPESWRLIQANAPRFGVAQPVAFAARSCVKAEERAWCDQQLTSSWTRFSRALRDLEYVTELLDSEGILSIPLKGPLLALRHYQPPFVRRPSVDLDIAVRDRDLERACAALVRAGYTSPVRPGEAKHLHHEIPFRHESKTPVELHFRLSHGVLGIDTDAVCDRAVACHLPSGRPSWALSPADELLHLALHVSSDRFNTLFHIYELHRIWRSSPPGIREEAIRTGVGYRFAGALALIDIGFRLYWNEPFVPSGIPLPKTWLHSCINERLYRSFENWFQDDRDRKLGSRLRGRWLDLQVTDRPSDALRMLPVLARVARSRLRAGQWGRISMGEARRGTRPVS
jgi:hypothetical protein